MDKLKFWQWPPEFRAVAASMGILLVGFVAAYAATTWYGIVDEEREWLGNSIHLVEDHQIAEPDLLLAGETAGEDPLLAIHEFQARMLLTITGFLALTACGVALLYCLPKVLSSPGYRVLYLVVVIPTVVVYLVTPPTDHLFPIYDTLLDRVECFRSLEHDEQNACKSDSESSSWTRFTKVANAFLVAAIFAIAVSVWRLLSGLTSLTPQAATDEKSLNARKSIVGEANRGIMVHLYLVSALLAVSVIALYSYFSWPAVVVLDEMLANELRRLASTIAIVFGTGFTLLIVALIGPAVYAINRRTEELATEATQLLNQKVTEDAKRSWREENGFIVTSQQKAIRLLAAIGPVLAGPVLELLNVSVV